MISEHQQRRKDPFMCTVASHQQGMMGALGDKSYSVAVIAK